MTDTTPQAKPVRFPRLIVHIGDPKTGTSSIQRALQDGSLVCEGRSILPWGKLNPRHVASHLTSEDEDLATRTAGHMRRWLNSSDADYAVISSEFIARTDPERLKGALGHHLPRYANRTLFIAYVRPHASRFLAAFVQRAKTGAYFGDFESFHEHVAKDRPSTLNYSPRFSRWREMFGDRFILRPFIRSELRNGDVVTDFFSIFLGEEPFNVAARIEDNVAVTTRALSGIRLLHQSLETRNIERRFRGELSNAIANYFIPMGEVFGDKPRLDKKTAEQLIDTYHRDAQMLDDTFFSRRFMTTALEDCTRDAIDEPISLEVIRNFGASEVRELERLVEVIGQSFTTCAKSWAFHHRARTGKRLPRDSAIVLGETDRQMVAELDSNLNDFATILRG